MAMWKRSVTAAIIATSAVLTPSVAQAQIPGMDALSGAASVLEGVGGAAANSNIPGVSDAGKMAEFGSSAAEQAGKSGEVFGGENVVAFGDSYFADSASPGSGGKCGQSDSNPPKLFGEKIGLPVDDYSCSGATAVSATNNSFESQVDLALEHGALSDDTKYVAISMGGNDGIAGVAAPAGVQYKAYFSAMDEQIERIREAAPNAEILQVGYPEVMSENNEFCPIHTSINRVLKVPGEFLRSQEYLINTHQQMVADKLDITFLDLKESTAGHGVCADDENRWVSGYADSSVKSTYTMPLHLTAKANEHIAQVLADAVDGEIPERSDAVVTREEALSPKALFDVGNQLMGNMGELGSFKPLVK